MLHNFKTKEEFMKRTLQRLVTAIASTLTIAIAAPVDAKMMPSITKNQTSSCILSVAGYQKAQS